MNQTDAVFGQIMAMNTFLENFPMSLFDVSAQKQYNTVFEFIIDVLYACNVDTNKIISTLLEKIYGVVGLAGSSIEGMLDRVRFGNIEVNTQNKFMEGVEWSIKSILMALFTSIFTCDSLPILPNSVFDYDGYRSENDEPLMEDGVISLLSGMTIPVSLIDITGMLDVSPTSYEGSLYYMTDGKDKYYKKRVETIQRQVEEEAEVHSGETYTIHVNMYDDEFPVVITYENNLIKVYVFNKTFAVLETPRINLEIKIDVLNTAGQTTLTKTIMSNENQTSFNIEGMGVTKIIGVTINGNETGGDITYEDGGVNYTCHLYLDKNHSNLGSINEDIKWGVSLIDKKKPKVMVATADTITTVVKFINENIYSYDEVEKKSIPKSEKIIRVSDVPGTPNANSPNYIVNFEGDNPNLLYRTYDMNAFIWYALNRGVRSSQRGKNQMMWDSRVEASKNSIKRNNEEWNEWINSKPYNGEELKFQSNPQHDFIYPIIQLEPQGSDKRNLCIHVPAQKYFKPKLRKKLEAGESGSLFSSSLITNESVYKYDWDYLKNIRILNPKILLSRLITNLFGMAKSLSSSYGFVERMIQGKLSSAIKDIIEANDMEIENCYKKFSNEDFDELLNEMLLERYSVSYSKDGGSRSFDISDYMNSIDKISENATTEGTTTSITKLVTEVTVTEGEEWSSDIDFEHKFDSNMLKRLIYAIVMPIIESIFTPQVILLIVINFEMLGVVNIEQFKDEGWSGVIKFFIYKILGLVKSIVLFIKDKIVEILLDLFYEYVRPLIAKYLQILLSEKLEYWLSTLYAALNCLPTMVFKLGFNSNVVGAIDEVDYADIVQPLSIPESSLEC